MKPKATFGIALLLATVFLLQPVVTCAAMFEPADSDAHSCCPRNPQPTAPKPSTQETVRTEGMRSTKPGLRLQA